VSREGLSNTKSKFKTFFMHRGREGPALRPFFVIQAGGNIYLIYNLVVDNS